MILVAAPAAIAVIGVAGVAGLRRSVRRSKVVAERQRTVAALRVLRSVAEAGGAVPYAADGLVEVLHLRSCRYEAGPAGEGGAPVLGAGGALSGRIHHRDRAGLLLPEVVHLGVPAGGRFVMVGHPERSTSLEERLAAVAIAELTRPGP